MTVWQDVDAARRTVLLLPLGAFEQHGPHLPLDTDTRIAAAVAAGAAARMDGAFAAPALPFGASGEHAAFPGTVSIGEDALAAVLVEAGRHAALHWPAVLFVNAHGGNAAAVTQAVGSLRSEGVRCEAFHATVPGGDAHAGRTETSLMLHLAPGEVRVAAAEAGDTRPIAELLPVLRRDGVRAVSPNGVLGDPAGASAVEGAVLLAALVDLCAGAVADV